METANTNLADASLDNACKRASYGSEPLCCGGACGMPSCASALWPGETRVLFGKGSLGGNAGSCGALTIRPDHEPRGVLCCKKAAAEAATEPAAAVASGTSLGTVLDQSGPGFLSWDGNSLRGIATVVPPPANMERWKGGMEGGPLVCRQQSPTVANSAFAVPRVDNGQ